MSSNHLLVGAASAFSGDRRDAAGPVVDAMLARGGPACLIYETLAERTLALAQLARRQDPEAGYDPWLVDVVQDVLAKCLRGGIAIVSNFGAANPRGAALRLRKLALEMGLPAPRIAVISGDDISGPEHRAALRQQLGSRLDESTFVSANLYQGADSIADALAAGAQIVVAGRVSDPALTVGPAMAHFGWARDDWMRRGKAVMVGHLIECGCQVTGGFFSDPGYKVVADLAKIGYPIAEISEDGDCVITKPEGTGGRVDTHVVKEQLLYEVHDPSAYVTPDAVSDAGSCTVQQVASDRVALRGVQGREWPAQLKGLVCHEGGWLAEGEISYSGPRAESRARQAAAILCNRLSDLDIRVDLIGTVSVLGDDAGSLLSSTQPGDARDVRLRVSANHAEKRAADELTREVTALYTCGPSGGGGVRTSLRPRLSTTECFLAREEHPTTFEMIG